MPYIAVSCQSETIMRSIVVRLAISNLTTHFNSTSNPLERGADLLDTAFRTLHLRPLAVNACREEPAVAMSPDALLRLVAIARRRAPAARTRDRGIFANANVDVDPFLLGVIAH